MEALMRVESSVKNSAKGVRVALRIFPDDEEDSPRAVASFDLSIPGVVELRDALAGIVATLLQHPVKA